MRSGRARLHPSALISLYPALHSLTEEEIAGLCAPASVVDVPVETELFSEHQPCGGFPLLISGAIKVVKSTPAGREILLYRVEPGGSCIISSTCLLGHSPYNARGVTQTAVRLATLPGKLFDRLIARNPDFRDFVFNLLAERVAELMQLVEEVAFHRLDQRLAKLLLNRDAPILTTHQALADELGSVREIVSRLLKNFSEQGLVALRREQIEVLDRDALQRHAGLLGGTSDVLSLLPERLILR